MGEVSFFGYDIDFDGGVVMRVVDVMSVNFGDIYCG